jgi:NAD(P) transhydrogenase
LNKSYDYDFLCIGSGPAGQRAAVQAAKLGKHVAIIEIEVEVGGVCVHKGTIPSKTFREAVLSLNNEITTIKDSPVEKNRRSTDRRRQPTAEKLFSRVDDNVLCESRVQREQLKRNGVDVIPGTASFDDLHSVRIASSTGDRVVTANKILIAAGTKPNQPKNISPDLSCVITSDDILQLEDLPRNLVVIGCGVIGIEYASMFANLGVEVTVVDGRSVPLEFLDNEIIDELVQQMEGRGVTFLLGESVDHIEPCDRASPSALSAEILLQSGKRLIADLVLMSTGRVGASDALNLDKAGLQADDRGRLSVDDHYRTSVPHIYAAGDIIGFPSLAATSSEQGRLAACHAFDVAVEAMPAHFPVGIYAIPEISMVGHTEQVLEEKKIPFETGVARYREIARGQILGDDSGFLKLIFHAEDRTLLGVHTIGTGATELIHVGQSVLGLGGGLDYFLNTVFNYPTLAECYKVAALDANNKLSLSQ